MNRSADSEPQLHERQSQDRNRNDSLRHAGQMVDPVRQQTVHKRRDDCDQSRLSAQRQRSVLCTFSGHISATWKSGRDKDVLRETGDPFKVTRLW